MANGDLEEHMARKASSPGRPNDRLARTTTQGPYPPRVRARRRIPLSAEGRVAADSQPAGAGPCRRRRPCAAIPAPQSRGPQFCTWARRSHHHAPGGGAGALLLSSRSSMSGKKSGPPGDVGRFGGATHSMGA